jgi:hypothetical protein
MLELGTLIERFMLHKCKEHQRAGFVAPFRQAKDDLAA